MLNIETYCLKSEAFNLSFYVFKFQNEKSVIEEQDEK